MKTALIFGAAGQDGIYMARLCEARGIEPITVSRSAGYRHRGSVSDRRLVEELVKQRPDFVFHLAANSTTRHEAMFENHETISTGTLNILESVRSHSPASRVLIVGSGLQFKNEGEGISEADPFEARDAYAVARIQSVYAARYFRTLGLRTYVAYLFNHESPCRHPGHFTMTIAHGIKRIQAGGRDKVVIGDPAVEKEWGFAREIVEGMFTLVNQDESFEAAIGTGVAHSIMDFVTECCAQTGLQAERCVEVTGGFQSEYSRLVSDPSTINRLGWTATTDLKALVSILLA